MTDAERAKTWRQRHPEQFYSVVKRWRDAHPERYASTTAVSMKSARRGSSQRMNTELMFSSKTDLWETPQELFDKYNAIYHFQTDVCALPENAKCERYYTPEQDGLAQTWGAFVGAILRMVGKLGSGLKKRLNRLPWWLCYFQHEQIQAGFTIGFCRMGRLSFCAEG